MITTPNHLDRRVQRTQQLLKQAFVEVVKEKGFPATSIQDVTDRANVNRGTFYTHFPDKYALFDAVVCEEIQRTLIDPLPPVSEWDSKTLHLFVQSVIESCDGRYKYLCLTKDMLPQFERAAHEGMIKLLQEWLKSNVRIRSQVSLEMIAHIMTSAIIGATMQYCQSSTTISSDEMASAVLLVLMKGVEQFIITDNTANTPNRS